MPIYAYRCAACGHSRDVLQKLSDSPLTQCPACGAEQFAKQITAAGFQLKGSGWYATDFRNGSNSPASAPAAKTDSPATTGGDSAPAASGADTGSAAASSSGTACGGSCACH